MYAGAVDYDALILAGGRSSRLGGVPKSGLVYDGATLLDRAIAAARGANRITVVGPEEQLPPGVLPAREDPPFSGPAAAIAAGLAALSRDRLPQPFTLVLACDMPLADLAVPALLAACAAGAQGAGGQGFGGVAAVSPDGRRQPLAGIYSTVQLQRNADDITVQGKLTNGSVRALLANLDVVTVPVPAGSTDDVDTWADAEAMGVARAAARNGSSRRPDEASLEADVKTQDQILEEWSRHLLAAFELEGVEVDVNAVLSLAGVAAHSIVRPAAPLTTFIAGYAAGKAAGAGQSAEHPAMAAAMALARKQVAEYSRSQGNTAPAAGAGPAVSDAAPVADPTE